VILGALFCLFFSNSHATEGLVLLRGFESEGIRLIPKMYQDLVTRYTSGYYAGRDRGLCYAPWSSSESTSGLGRRGEGRDTARRVRNAQRFGIGDEELKEWK
jgi:hypothetical protein